MKYSVIGNSTPRLDGIEKVTGEAVYSADISFPGILIGKIKRSPHPFAKILSINTYKARKLAGVKAVITAQTVAQCPYGVYVADELPLADKYVRYFGESVAAVAAVDIETTEEALDLIEVEYEELPPVLNPEEAMADGVPAIHPEITGIKQNIIDHLDFARGQGEAAFEQADVIVQERFSTQCNSQAYLEPQACSAQWDASGKLTVWGATQRIFVHRDILAKGLGISSHQVRIIQPHVGGSFGAKITMHPIFFITALLAQVANQAVQITHTREEEFMAGRPHVSSVLDLALGLKKNGLMIAKNAVVTMNAGAYANISPSIMRRSVARADSLYRLPHIKMVANLVYTNTTPRGAFRGFGDPQHLFAMENLIDIAADKLGIDPIELRLKNAVQKGNTTQHGFLLKSCAFSDTLKLVSQQSDWIKKRQKRGENRGIGVACQIHGAGNKAVSKEYGYDGSAAVINIDQYGKATVFSGQGDIGQGALTIFAQIAAETLGMAIEDIDVMPTVDTDISPFNLGTTGSRVTVMDGNAVHMAAIDARKQLKEYAAQKVGVKTSDLEIKHSKFYIKGSPEHVSTVKEIAHDTIFTKNAGVPITGKGEYKAPDYTVPPDKSEYGNYSIAWTFSTAIVEVSVDVETGKVNVLNVWHVFDLGKALNPGTAQGQIEGGAVQGIGYALNEDYVYQGGILQNLNFTDYKIPLSEDTPKIHSSWIEKPNPASPYGAKAIGEASLTPIAPAIANAVYHATGNRITSLPITPEKLLEAIRRTKAPL